MTRLRSLGAGAAGLAASIPVITLLGRVLPGPWWIPFPVVGVAAGILAFARKTRRVSTGALLGVGCWTVFLLWLFTIVGRGLEGFD